MDPKDKEIADLKASLEAKTKEVQTLSDKVKFSEYQIKEKDRIITEKNTDIVGLRKAKDRVKELSEEEKAQLSESEKIAHENSLLLQQQIEEQNKALEEYRVKEVESKRNAMISKLAGDNPELAEKIKFNFDRVKGSEEAHTEEDILKIATDAKNMLGPIDPPKQPITFDNNGGDGMDGGRQETFADTQDGKQLSDMLGI